MNRNEKVKAALLRVDSKLLNEEIEHFLSVDDDEDREHDYYDALDQALLLAEDNNDRKMLKVARRAFIELGCIRPISDYEISRTVSIGGKKFDFQMNGIKFVWDHHLSGETND